MQTLLGAYKQQFATHEDLKISCLWLCCSGGRDSLGLAYAFNLIRHDIHHAIKVIHINHQLQSQADAWQTLVTDFCAKYQLDYQLDAVSLSNKSENSARQARFQQIYSHISPNDVLVLAHHADDQAETLLMNLCKGTGLSGLSGMAQFGFFPENIEQTVKAHWRFRPWLSITRSDITDFCQQVPLNYIDDPTNIAGDNTRAFIRREVMPLLNKKWQKAASNIARTALNVSEAKQMIDGQVLNQLQTITNEHGHICLIDFLKLAQANQFAVIKQWMQQDADYAPPRHMVQQVIQLATADNSSVADTQTTIKWGNLQFRRYDGYLYRLNQHIPEAVHQQITVTNEACLALPCGKWHIHFTNESPFKNTNLKSIQAIWSNSSSNSASLLIYLPMAFNHKLITIRAPIAGERIHIYGRVGSWPLKKFFQQIRLPPWQRKQTQIICIDDNPIAVLCHQGIFYTQNILNFW